MMTSLLSAGERISTSGTSLCATSVVLLLGDVAVTTGGCAPILQASAASATLISETSGSTTRERVARVCRGMSFILLRYYDFSLVQSGVVRLTPRPPFA